MATVSYQELMAWGEYAKEEPFGEWRADVRIAQLCALYANAHRPEGEEPRKIADFMLFDKPSDAPEEVPEDGPRLDPMLAVMIAVAKRKKEREANG